MKYITAGKSSMIFELDDERVLKRFFEPESSKKELQVYNRLGSHPNIAKILETTTDSSIILERGMPLRKICRAPTAVKTPIQEKVRWLRDAAEGYQHLHNLDVLHCDVGSSNLILLKDGRLKLIDFEGCSVDGGTADSCYEWFSYCPSTPRVSKRTEVFAFGCLIYEVLTGRPPYHELEGAKDSYRQVEKAYTDQHFPDVEDVPLDFLMKDCWHGNISSMSQVIQELDAFRKSVSSHSY